MKHLLLCCCLLAASPIFAQKGLEFGVRVMPQATGIINDDDFAEGDDLNFSTTIHVAYGVHVGYNFSNNLGIQTGLLVSQQGQKYVDDSPTPATATSETRSNYLKIPLLLKFNTNPSKGAQFVGTLGVQFGLLNSVDGFVNDENVSDDLEAVLGKEFKEAYNSSDLAAVLGLGARFRLSDKMQLGTHLRLDYSLSDIENKDFTIGVFNYWGTDRAASKNATVGLMLELNYALGGGKE
jgi:hypothetical protein